jgi:superfamily I DNA and/or RNA helicase
MHPDVCRFISAAIYEDRLESFADCANQKHADLEAVLIDRIEATTGVEPV